MAPFHTTRKSSHSLIKNLRLKYRMSASGLQSSFLNSADGGGGGGGVSSITVGDTVLTGAINYNTSLNNSDIYSRVQGGDTIFTKLNLVEGTGITLTRNIPYTGVLTISATGAGGGVQTVNATPVPGLTVVNNAGAVQITPNLVSQGGSGLGIVVSDQTLRFDTNNFVGYRGIEVSNIANQRSWGRPLAPLTTDPVPIALDAFTSASTTDATSITNALRTLNLGGFISLAGSTPNALFSYPTLGSSGQILTDVSVGWWCWIKITGTNTVVLRNEASTNTVGTLLAGQCYIFVKTTAGGGFDRWAVY